MGEDAYLLRRGPHARVQDGVGAVGYLYHARPEAVQIEPYDARVRRGGRVPAAGEYPLHGGREARERGGVRLRAGHGYGLVALAPGPELRPAAAYLREPEAVPLAHVLLGEAGEELRRGRYALRRLPRARERARIHAPDALRELKAQQRRLHTPQRAEGEVGAAYAHMLAAGEVRLPVAYQIECLHGASREKISQ